MSSWQEYKKKKQKNATTSSSDLEKSSNSEISSWERYKQEKQNKINNKATTNVQAPKEKTNTKINLPTNNTKSTFGPVQTQQSGINRNIKSNTKTSIKNLANNVVEHKKEKEEKNKFVNKSGLSTMGSDAKIIGSNLLNSAHAGALQFAKTVNMRLDEAENARRETDKKLLETAIKYREEDGEDVSELKSVLNSDRYKEVDSKPNYQEKIKQINTKMTENTEKASNVFSKKIADLSQGLGNNIVGAGITALNPIAGTTYFIGSATGSYYDEAVAKGMNEDDAKLYAGIMGSMEGATEAFLSAQNIKGFRSILEGQTAKDTLKAFGLEIGENFIQEAVMEPLSELTTKVTGGNQFLKNDYRTVDGWKNLLTDSFFSGVDGALSAILLNGATKGVASATRVVNKLNNGTKPMQTEIQTAIKDSKGAGINVEQVLQEQLIKSAEKNLTQQNNIVENNQETLYNNNERESGINGRNEQNENEQRADSRLFTQYEEGKGIGARHQEYNEQQRELSKQEEIDYIRNPQNQIKEINDIQKGLKENYKNNGVDIVYYSLESGRGGYYDNGKLYINLHGVSDSEIKDVITHEYAHHLIRNNGEFNEKVRPLANQIIAEEQEEIREVIRNYIMQHGETIDVSDVDMVYQTVIEEILADYAIEISNNVDFETNNKYGVNVDILNNYSNILKDYLPTENSNKSSFIVPIPEKTMQDVGAPVNNISKKILNPTAISNLATNDANTTPVLPIKNYKRGNKESSFLSNITTDAGFLNEDLRHEMTKEDNIRYYKGITNQETLEKAYNSLNKDGKNATLNWFNKESKNVTAEDVAKGWILLKQYQDAGDHQSAVEVAKKMREMGTSAGQATQAYNILSRLTPEGMFFYAQSELTEAYNQMVKGKSKEWIDKNASKFDLTAEETQIIMDTMQDVSTMEDGYEKKVKIAEIQKLISDKIPSKLGQSIKAWMRISMLFNPKTQVRNILGNAVILPVNVTSDFISSGIDKAISKKTGVRTTGNINLKNYGKGFKKGLFESYNDFRKGINTRNIEGNRFEISEGRSFNNKGIGKALNRVDSLLSFMLDAGDRGFYESTFTNSINNQLVLNNTTEVTAEMIDIATNEALQRTWQDNNKYTESVLKIRKILNAANIKGYGLGDVLIPFAKTPANLTKAIVDYSPIGLIKTVALDAKTFKNSLQNGQFTPQLQHKFVQDIGKGMAGSFLYVLGYALAKAGIASGEADDDKDVKNFMKNSLGINSYSIKIGNKTFTYDWAQPVATPLAIMTNYAKYSKDNPDANIIEKAINSLNIGTEQLLEQSFMQSLNTVLNGNGTTLENLSQSILELPARAIPTFSKQIADMVDGTQRTSFEYDKPVKSAINSIAAKIPVASKILPVSRDTLGNEIKKYGGENNIFNVMFNPANVNKGELSKAGEEIYRLYQETGETSVFPITAPYYVNSKGEKITMTAEERSKYQKVTGDYAEKAITELLSNSSYKRLSDEKKAELLKEIITDSNAKAKHDVLNIETKDAKKKRELIEAAGTKSYYDYKFKTKDLEKEIEKVEVLASANYSNKIKAEIYERTIGQDDSLYGVMKESNIDTTEYLKYKSQKFESNKKDDGTIDGKTVSGSKKKKVVEYVNKMNITYNQKLLLLGTQYSLTSQEKTKLAHYINGMNISKKRKMEIYDKISGFTVYKDGRIKW